MNYLSRIRNLFSAYNPALPENIDEERLLLQTSNFFGLPVQKIQEDYQMYMEFTRSRKYSQILKEHKTLSKEEAFLLYEAIKLVVPEHIVEIGTQYGKSTRRILDILNWMNLSSQLICYDIVDELKYIDHEEITLVLKDLTGNFNQSVLEKYKPGLIYLDAHPYELLLSVIKDFIDWSTERMSILAIHDCSSRLFRAKMSIARDTPELISSKTGLWERHVLGEIFKVNGDDVDDVITNTHVLKVFETPHGLGLIAPRNTLES